MENFKDLNDLELLEVEGGAIPPFLLNPNFWLGAIAVIEFVDTMYDNAKQRFYEAGKEAAYKELGY